MSLQHTSSCPYLSFVIKYHYEGEAIDTMDVNYGTVSLSDHSLCIKVLTHTSSCCHYLFSNIRRCKESIYSGIRNVATTYVNRAAIKVGDIKTNNNNYKYYQIGCLLGIINNKVQKSVPVVIYLGQTRSTKQESV